MLLLFVVSHTSDVVIRFFKGCGIVEYSTPEEAQDAKENLNDSELFGMAFLYHTIGLNLTIMCLLGLSFLDRKIFVREDREENPDFRGRSPHTMNAGRRRSWTNNRPTLQNKFGAICLFLIF
jgi:RNA recognition motif-containing protein